MNININHLDDDQFDILISELRLLSTSIWSGATLAMANAQFLKGVVCLNDYRKLCTISGQAVAEQTEQANKKHRAYREKRSGI